MATTGPAAQRKTILHFRLARRARVVFTVTQIAPECRVVGRFAVKGRAGLNKVAFSSRVDGHRLAPGTYRIAARVGSGRTFLRVVVVVFATAPSPTELDRARRADVCASSRLLAASAAPASGGAAGNTGSGASESPPASSEIVRNQASHTSPKGHVSAAPFSPARIGRNATNPLVLGALGLAVLLLGVAALPQRALPNPRLTDVVARHRVEVALAGGGALAAALLALALS